MNDDKKPTAKEFGDILKKIRNEKRMTLIDFEKTTGYSNSYLSQIENGHKGMPSPELIKKLAKGLNVSYQYLMDLAGHREHDYYIDEIFDDIDRHSTTDITVSLPMMDKKIDDNNVEHTFVLSEDELKRRLFDLHDYLNMDIDLYYKNNYLTDYDKAKISTMLTLLFDNKEGD